MYEHHTVFVDKLVFPRFATPFGADSVLTMETNADEVWKITDTNGDGVGDSKELFTANFGRGGHMEQQQSVGCSGPWTTGDGQHRQSLPHPVDAGRHGAA